MQLIRALVAALLAATLASTADAQEPTTSPAEQPTTSPPEAPTASSSQQQPQQVDEAPSSPPSAASTSSLVTRARSDVAAYGDTDHVFVFTPGVSGSVESPTEGWSVSGSYLVDVVSAASVDIVSTASRRWEEVRHAGSLSGTWKPGNFGVAPSASFSVEPDYTSLTGGLVLTQDLNNKNLTLLGGYEHGHDIAGRSSTPFSVFARVIDHDTLKGGLTLVIDPATILTTIGEVSFERGDTSKPYRYIPLFAPGTTLGKGASIDEVNATRLPERVLEQLPTNRQRGTLSARLAHRFATSTLRLDQRLYGDSWALFASTTDARYIFDLSRRFSIGPHLRAHLQKAVSFWQRTYELRPGYDYPALRTGDRELGPLYTLTGGGSFRVGLGRAADPMGWALGFDANAAYTRYLDDLYVTSRVSFVSSLSLEVTF